MSDKKFGLLGKLISILPSEDLVMTFKTFIIPHFYYGDDLCDQPFNSVFHDK